MTKNMIKLFTEVTEAMILEVVLRFKDVLQSRSLVATCLCPGFLKFGVF